MALESSDNHVGLGSGLALICCVLFPQSPEATEYTKQIKERLKAAEYLGKFVLCLCSLLCLFCVEIRAFFCVFF